MREYTVKLEETEKTLVSSLGDDITEAEMVLQIWQDLEKIDSQHEEDILIRKLLFQILEAEHMGAANIYMPNYYKDKEDRVVKLDEEINEG